jgi:hypothetical protein
MGHSICPTIDIDKRTKPKPRSKKIDVAKKIVGVGSLKHLRFVHLFDDDGAIAFKDHCSKATIHNEVSH